MTIALILSMGWGQKTVTYPIWFTAFCFLTDIYFLYHIMDYLIIIFR